MPKRSNEFQRVVTAVYHALSPIGAKLQESVLLREITSGVEREIDALITMPAFGTEIAVAVECRDYNRDQSVEWIDNLIGKYRDLPVDKVIAVSDSNFSEAARSKADNTKIDLVVAEEVDQIDWSNSLISKFNFVDVQHELMVFAGFDQNGNRFLGGSKNSDDSDWTFDSELSEELAATMSDYFLKCVWPWLYREIEEKYIKPKIGKYKDGEKRYAEVSVDDGLVIYHNSGSIYFHKIVYGVGSIFSVEPLDGFHRKIHGMIASELSVKGHVFTMVQGRKPVQP